MKLLYLIFLLAAFTVSAQTNQTPWCCRYPLRVMGATAGVNLAPLFQWWTQNGGTNKDQPAAAPGDLDTNRPLMAWKRITGVKTSDLGGVWVVEAHIYTSPSTRTNSWILLQNPPAAEEQQYYDLQSLLAQDARQIAADARTNEKDLKAADKEHARAVSADSSFSKSVRAYDGANYSALEAQYRRAAAAALNDQKQYEQGRAQALQQFNALPGENGRYQIDLFALEMGRNAKGQLVYDAGQIYQGAP